MEPYINEYVLLKICGISSQIWNNDKQIWKIIRKVAPGRAAEL